jgi:hypothetical protein
MSVEFSKAIYTRLMHDAGGGTNPLRTLVSDRIFAIEAPAQTALPLVVYAVMGSQTSRDFGGTVKEVVQVSVTMFGKAEDGADAILDIEDAAFDLLDQRTLAVSSYDRGYMRNISRGSAILNGEYFSVESVFQISGNKTS